MVNPVSTRYKLLQITILYLLFSGNPVGIQRWRVVPSSSVSSSGWIRHARYAARWCCKDGSSRIAGKRMHVTRTVRCCCGVWRIDWSWWLLWLNLKGNLFLTDMCCNDCSLQIEKNISTTTSLVRNVRSTNTDFRALMNLPQFSFNCNVIFTSCTFASEIFGYHKTD